MLEETSRCLEKVRAQRPLVHSITNYVAMNFTANALLALGASPVMAHAVEEVEAMVKLASVLVINIGTLSRPWVEAMFLAACAASERMIPIVLDPVAASPGDGPGQNTRVNRYTVEAIPPMLPRICRIGNDFPLPPTEISSPACRFSWSSVSPSWTAS